MLAVTADLTSAWIARPDVALSEDDRRGTVVTGAWIDLALGPLSPGVRASLRRIFTTGAIESEVSSTVMSEDGLSALPGFLLLVRELEAAAVLGRRLMSEGEPFASVIPVRALRPLHDCVLPADVERRLSRFAYWHVRDGEVVIESPLGRGRLVLHNHRAAGIAHHLATGGTAGTIADSTGWAEPECRAMIELAHAAHLLDDGDADAAQGWEFADLLLHTRSRLGRHGDPYGGTYRFAGVTLPEAVLKPVRSNRLVDLPPLDLTVEPGSLGDVMERRTSIRQYGDEPLTLEQLATLLGRAHRHRRTIPTPTGELGSRPYPAGGALYELEIYPVVDRCDGLERGVYRYVPDTHQLEQVAESSAASERVLADAYFTMAQEGRPDVLLVITARFGRVMWKYESIAYSLVLKHVGVLFQTLYLVATDMGLAACALGGGNSDLFGEAAGLQYLEEGSVGEFAIGSRPADPRTEPHAPRGERPAMSP
jgi:oxazoline/thiazoline dehydrogenase